MENRPIHLRRWLMVPTLALLAAALPLTMKGGEVKLQDACAQTGTCKYNKPDICVVNGTLIFEHEWKGAGG